MFTLCFGTDAHRPTRVPRARTLDFFNRPIVFGGNETSIDFEEKSIDWSICCYRFLLVLIAEIY